MIVRNAVRRLRSLIAAVIRIGIGIGIGIRTVARVSVRLLVPLAGVAGLAAAVLYGLALLAMEEFEHDPQPLLAGATDGLWVVGTNGTVQAGDQPPLRLAGHEAPLTLAVFTEDGCLLTGAADGSIRWQDTRIIAGVLGFSPFSGLADIVRDYIWQPWFAAAARQALDLTAQVLPLWVPVTRRGRRGRVFRDCPECPELIELSAGQVWQGSPWTETNRYSDEGPRRLVTIDHDLAVGKYEVTFAEWDACVAQGGCGGYRPEDKGWGRGRRPVINVSWTDAQGYVQWLSRKTGQTYRLLSESEWEYAARGGTTTPFWTGGTITTDQASFNGTDGYNGGKKGVYREKTVEVGSFRANPFGLHDVHGNVWEWVEDCGNDSYNDVPGNGSAWTDGNCDSRVLRGGSWLYFPSFVRSAYRYRNGVVYRLNDSASGLYGPFY